MTDKTYKSFRSALEEVANYKKSDLDKYKSISTALEEVKAISSFKGKPANDTGSKKSPSFSDVDSSVKDWHDQHVEKEAGKSVTAMDAYEHYKNWCSKNEKDPIALPTFGRHLGNLGHEKAKIGGRVRHTNIELKPVREIEEAKYVTTSDGTGKGNNKKKMREKKPTDGYADHSHLTEHRVIAKNAMSKLSESFIWRKNAGAIADHLFEMLNDGKLSKDQPLNECILGAYESLKARGNLK